MIAQKPEKRYRNLDEALKIIDDLAKVAEKEVTSTPPPVQTELQETVESKKAQSSRLTVLLFVLLIVLSLLFYLQFYEAFQAFFASSLR